jgi:cytochrome c oxidase subunit 2
MLKHDSMHPGEISAELAQRLLETKKILTLPIHANISLMTNSYDVVHSWSMPGQSYKYDCVPGRSSHNGYYHEGIGYLYGHCSEICGRYHHHMPIRVYGLPYEDYVG